MTYKMKQLKEICEGVDYEIFQDKTLMANARIGAEHYGISLNECAPTFILKSDEVFVVLTIQGSNKVDFKKVKKFLGAKNVTMATKDEILDLTGSPIGSVAMINPNLQTLIDSGLKDLDYCYGGCGVENYTLKIGSADLIKITNAKIGDFTKAHSEQMNEQ